MAVIEGGTVLSEGTTTNIILEGTLQIFSTNGVPGGTDYDGEASPGALCINRLTNDVYENQGTLASPTWAQISTV